MPSFNQVLRAFLEFFHAEAQSVRLTCPGLRLISGRVILLGGYQDLRTGGVLESGDCHLKGLLTVDQGYSWLVPT
eukprot:6474970-Amphidinium_carterae.1